jgi:hypothetical protein
VLVVLDELGEYLRRVQNIGGRDQLTAFLKALLTAIESTPSPAFRQGEKALRENHKGMSGGLTKPTNSRSSSAAN